MNKIFKGYDIRGIVPDQFNSELSYLLGLGIGNKFKSTSLAFDTRKTSEALSYAFLAGFLESGGEVLFQGLANFGLAMFPAFVEKLEIASFITASHLPPEYNGIKFYRSSGVAFGGDELKAILDNLGSYKPVNWRNYGNVEFVDYTEEYVGFVSDGIDLEEMKFAVDCGGGATSLVANFMFNMANGEPKEIYCKPNPSFSDRPSEPNPENISKLVETCKKEEIPGIAFDGDGDRAVFVDERGKFISPDILGLILARRILEENGKATIIVNNSASMAFDELANEGARVIRVPVGHTYMTSAAIDNNADLGVESSGHIILPRKYPFDDAFVWVLEILELAKEKPLSELAKEVPGYPKKEITIKVSDEKKWEIIEKVKEYALEKFADVNTLDGVKIRFDDSWVLIRASNTSPKIRIVVETKDEDELEKLLERFKSLVVRYI